jgi:hypothetical protein
LDDDHGVSLLEACYQAATEAERGVIDEARLEECFEPPSPVSAITVLGEYEPADVRLNRDRRLAKSEAAKTVLCTVLARLLALNWTVRGVRSDQPDRIIPLLRAWLLDVGLCQIRWAEGATALQVKERGEWVSYLGMTIEPLERAPRRAGRAQPTQATINAWILAYYQRARDEGRPAPKRDEAAFPACRDETGATFLQMKAAMRQVPTDLKRGKGDHDRRAANRTN